MVSMETFNIMMVVLTSKGLSDLAGSLKVYVQSDPEFKKTPLPIGNEPLHVQNENRPRRAFPFVISCHEKKTQGFQNEIYPI